MNVMNISKQSRMHGKLFPSFTDEPFDVLIGNILNFALVVDSQLENVESD